MAEKWQKKKTRKISLDMYRKGPAGGPYTT